MIEKFLATPELRERADERLQELIEDIFPPAWFRDRVAALKEQIEDSIGILPGAQAFANNARNQFSDPDLFSDQVEALIDFIELRYQFIRRQLEDITGAENLASAEIAPDQTSPVFLTDGTGFTIAVIEPVQPFSQATEVEIEVVPNPNLIGIDHEYLLTVTGGAGPVDITLFYRNEVSQSLGKGNWWTGGTEPIGNQKELMLFIEQDQSPTQSFATRINPVSNKATARVPLDAGRYQLQLRLPIRVGPIPD